VDAGEDQVAPLGERRPFGQHERRVLLDREGLAGEQRLVDSQGVVLDEPETWRSARRSFSKAITRRGRSPRR
jgi:hypothetical protein